METVCLKPRPADRIKGRLKPHFAASDGLLLDFDWSLSLYLGNHLTHESFIYWYYKITPCITGQPKKAPRKWILCCNQEIIPIEVKAEEN